jgi:hypothetical protein
MPGASRARRAREDYNAIERDLDAGESFVISAYADHHPAWSA